MLIPQVTPTILPMVPVLVGLRLMGPCLGLAGRSAAGGGGGAQWCGAEQ